MQQDQQGKMKNINRKIKKNEQKNEKNEKGKLYGKCKSVIIQQS